jgi:hypothetical protein
MIMMMPLGYKTTIVEFKIAIDEADGFLVKKIFLEDKLLVKPRLKSGALYFYH